MRRRLLNLLTALSLLLCVAVVVLWVRSYWRNDVLLRFGHGTILRVDSDRGLMLAKWGTSTMPPEWPVAWTWVTRPTLWHGSYRDMWRSKWGFWVGRDTGTDVLPGGDKFQVLVPHWFLSLLFGLPPAASVSLRLRRHRRNNHGLCTRCGYDLRATPGQCPECGTVPKTSN